MDGATIQRLLAFVHPAWMLMSLAVALYTARLGLVIRRRRGAGQSVGWALRNRHLRFGKRAIVLIGLGFLQGPLSMILFRERAWFDSFHGILGIIVLGLFTWTGLSGRALVRGKQDARDIHRIAAASAIGAAMLSAVAGFVLLP